MKIKIYTTIILSVVLYGCETYTIALRMPRRIFGSERDENGEWRRFHYEKLHSLYRSPNIVRPIKSSRLRWAGHVSRMEDMKETFRDA